MAASCKNCRSDLTGHFCANCGQAAEVHVPSTQELAHELFEGVTHMDSRLWRTLKLLWFKPGGLTLEFIAGRRVAYLPPFRLYLVMSVIFFLTASFSPLQREFMREDAGTPNIRAPVACSDIEFELFGSHRWEQRARHACDATLADHGASLQHVAWATMPKAMFLFLPLIALLNMLMYWRPRHRYAEQLLFFVHLHAFFFSAATLILAVSSAAAAWAWFGPFGRVLVTLLDWSLPLYAVLAVKRVFERSWVRTLFKTLALFLVYSIVLGITVGGVYTYAIFQI